ncbi:MAG TPA: NUDIX domain-containing protein [Herpetosiphonaceae bacterium]
MSDQPSQLPAQSPPDLVDAEPWPTVGVSVVIFSLQPGAQQQELSVLLVRRKKPPYAGLWALPGGWVRTGEGLEEAARRHLHTKAGLTPTYLEQLYTFGRPDRDPREHRIAVAYYALVSSTAAQLPEAQTDREARWFPAEQVPRPLAFDHDAILSYALWRLRNKVSYAYVAYQLLPPTFTLADLRNAYEVILGHPLDPTNFRRKVEASGTIVSTGKRVEGGAHRPPQLYRCKLTPEQLFPGPPS